MERLFFGVEVPDGTMHLGAQIPVLWVIYREHYHELLL